MNQTKAILFDLDDTLFDHKLSRLSGLQALQQRYPALQATSLRELEAEHERLLQANYGRVLEGKLSVVDGTVERIRRLCLQQGLNLSAAEAEEATDLYSRTYSENRQPVYGSKELLRYLKNCATVGVVTDGLVDAQREKIVVCGLEGLVDFVVISEEVGVRKPDRGIFEAALKRASAMPFEVVYVGDSWCSDIVPAHECGFKTVWLNRYAHPCPDPEITTEITSYTGLDYQALFP